MFCIISLFIWYVCLFTHVSIITLQYPRDVGLQPKLANCAVEKTEAVKIKNLCMLLNSWGKVVSEREETIIEVVG